MIHATKKRSVKTFFSTTVYIEQAMIKCSSISVMRAYSKEGFFEAGRGKANQGFTLFCPFLS